MNKFIEIAQVILAFSNKHPYNASMSYSIQNTNTAGLGRSDLRELYLSRLAAQPATGESSAPADGLIETPIHSVGWTSPLGVKKNTPGRQPAMLMELLIQVRPRR